jgi:serine/threonine protein kinase/formylglycine-generating enzyme required for sulfatase activity
MTSAHDSADDPPNRDGQDDRPEDAFDRTMPGGGRPEPDAAANQDAERTPPRNDESSDTPQDPTDEGSGIEHSADGDDEVFDRTLAGSPPPAADAKNDGRTDHAATPNDGGTGHDGTLAGPTGSTGPVDGRAGANGRDDTIEGVPPPPPADGEDDLTPEARRARAARAGDTRPEPPPDQRPPQAPPGMRLSPAESALLGKTLGDCRIEQLLGRGAMGAVFKATQKHLDRTVAVKTIRPDRLLDDNLLKRFQQEARLVSRFTSPHVVQVYGAGEQDGLFYFVMQFVPGGTVAEYAHSLPEQRIPERDAVRFLRECTLALKEASELATLHRDIKPENILLDAQGRAMLSDFGIAKALDERAQLTMSMDQVGTPLYMSPEQCSGLELDFRSDMWSLGATFYYLTTNVPPAEGSSIIELIRNKSETECLSPSRTPAGFGDDSPFSKIIERMTALDRDHRYVSWDELLADLDELNAHHESAPKRASDTVRRRIARTGTGTRQGSQDVADAAGQRTRTLLIAAALAVVVLGGGSLLALQQESVRRLLGMQSEQAPVVGGGRTDASEHNLAATPGTIDDPFAVPDPDLREPDEKDPPPEVVEPGPEETGLAGLDPGSAPNSGPNPVEPEPISGADDSPARADDPFEEQQALAALTDFEVEFGNDGPSKTLESAVQRYQDLDFSESVRRRSFELLRRIERATEVRDELDELATERKYLPIEPPFVQLAEFVGKATRLASSGKSDDGSSPRWLQTRMDEDILTADLRGKAFEALEKAIDSWHGSLPKTASDVDILGESEALTTLGASKVRLCELFPEAREAGARLEEKLQRASDALARLDRLGPLAASLGALESDLGSITTLRAWRERREDEKADPVAALASFDATHGRWLRDSGLDLSASPLGDRRDQIAATVARWTAWHEHVRSTCGLLEGGASAGRTATALRRGPSAAGDDRIPGDVVAAADRLDEVQAVYDALDRTADVRAANETLVAIDRAALDLLSPAARIRLERAARALDDLARRVSETMVPVAAGTVNLVISERRRRDQTQEEVVERAFLIGRFEVTRTEWLEFLQVMRPDGTTRREWADVEREYPGIWPDEETWRQATSDLRAVSKDAETNPDLPITRISCREAAAFARWKGGDLPTHAQWWLAARGPAGEDTFPWGQTDQPPRALARQEKAMEVDSGGESARLPRVHFLSGNVAEWIRTDHMRECVAVGGSFRDDDAERLGGQMLERVRRVRGEGWIGFRIVTTPRAVLREAWLGSTDR